MENLSRAQIIIEIAKKYMGEDFEEASRKTEEATLARTQTYAVDAHPTTAFYL